MAKRLIRRPIIRKPPVIKHEARKHVVAGGVKSGDRRAFKIERKFSGEEDLWLYFGSPLPYKIVKLEIKDLPRKHKGRDVQWLCNFGIRGSTRKYLGRLNHNYIVLVPMPRRKHLVCKDQAGIHPLKVQKLGLPVGPDKELVYFKLTSGDPAIGVT